MGFAAFEQIKKDEKISTDAAVNARIQRIGARVAEAVGREVPDAQWEFVVFESDTINAFALPGGKVGFYTGLIKLAESDEEIATVMGHEIAHVTSRHGAERVSQGQLAAIGGVVAAVVSDGSKNQNAYMLGYTALATLGTLGYSRLQETEADVIGLRFSSSAGYDPRAAASFWRKMKAANEGRGAPPIWLSTHPSTAARIAKLEELAEGTPLALKIISNRGTVVYPLTGAPTDCVDHWRCRFLARDPKADLSYADVAALMVKVTQIYRLIHLEMLLEVDGKRAYALAQGED